MGFIYQESNAYGVEALVALERHYTPTEEKYCTAVTEAVAVAVALPSQFTLRDCL